MTEILFARQDEIDAIADQFAPLAGLAALGSIGIITLVGPGVWVSRTITGTDGEISIVNGNGNLGEPEIHLATELVFTGKTIDGGTFTSPTITGPTLSGGTYTGGTFSGGNVSAELIISSLGTKAVTLASFAGRVVDVNDFTGAVNDGSADTYSAVAAAYAAACNGMVPGGVLFSKGTYLFAQQTPTGTISNPTITIKSKCHTFFEGARILSQNGPAGGWGYRDAIFINETNATDISFSGSAEFQVANKGVLLTGGTTDGSKFVTVSSVSDLKVGMGLAGTNIVEPSIINEINGSGCIHPCVKINNDATGTCPSGIPMKAGWSGGPFISIVDASRVYIGGDLTFLDQEAWTNQIWFSNHIVLARITDYVIDGVKGAYVLKSTTEGSDYGGEGLIYLAGGVQHGLITNVQGTSGDDCIAMDLNSTLTGTSGFDLDISFNVISNVSCKSLWAQVLRATVEPTTSVGEIKNNHFIGITGTADAYAGSIDGCPQQAQGIIVEDRSGRGTIANHDNTFTNITLDCTHALNPCINVQIAKNITFVNTDTQTPASNHIYLAHCVDCVLINPRANTANGTGNSIEADVNTSGLQIIGGLVTSNSGGNGVYIKGPNASVTGMFIHDNAGYGLVLDGATYAYVGGNTFSTNGGGQSVVEINAADHNQITDNVLHGQGVVIVGANSFSFDTTSKSTARVALGYTATSPIAINNSTGVISCASCITSASGAALTKVDDTNVTLTLGGSASTALLNAASLTLGWTGTLSPTRGGTGVANNAASTITISGNFATTFTVSAATNATLPAGTHTLAGLNVTQSWDGTNTYSATSLIKMTSGAAVATDDLNEASNSLHTVHRAGGNTTQFGNGKLIVTDAGAIQFVTGYGAGTLISDSSGNITSNTTTGTGDSVKATSATLITPTLGVASVTSINKITITAPASGATLTIVNGKTATFNNSIQLSGTDGKTLTLTGALTVSTNDGTISFGAASKTLTVNNSIGISGTDGSTINVGTGGTLGTAAFQATGTSGGTIPFLNGGNTWSGSNIFTATGGIIIKNATQSAIGFQAAAGGITGWVIGRSLAGSDLNDLFIYDNTLGARRFGIAATTGVVTFDAYGAGVLTTSASGIISATPKVSFSATKGGTSQTAVTSGVATKVTFGTEDFDVGSYYDNSVSTFTPLVAGKYLITAQITYSAGVVDQSLYAISIYKNGVQYRQGIAGASGTSFTPVNVSAIVDMNGSTDYIEIYASGFGAGDKTIQGATTNTYFNGTIL